jgi:hypothetical protein
MSPFAALSYHDDKYNRLKINKYPSLVVNSDG